MLLSRQLSKLPNFIIPRTTACKMSTDIKYLGQSEAIAVDQELFNTYKFSVEQLMELAGLSVATVVYKVYSSSHKESPILAIAGPGNNGGDAMVAVRHLKLFGFSNVTLLNTRPPTKQLFIDLVHQAQESGVQVEYDPQPFLSTKPSLVLDGLFGFSFKPPVRPDFQPFMDILLNCNVPVVSIDIPSGWDVEKGPPEGIRLNPDTLVSLTAPKKCAKFFVGNHHYLGGRFVPPQMAEKFQLNLPDYPGTDCVLQL